MIIERLRVVKQTKNFKPTPVEGFGTLATNMLPCGLARGCFRIWGPGRKAHFPIRV